MNWQELIELRHTTFAWREDKIPLFTINQNSKK